MRTIKRDIVGAFLFSGDNKVLLGKTGTYEGQWVVPGGGIEPGESKRAALNREIAEETGLDISNANVSVIETVNNGESEKILRGTGERVHVKMVFYDFVVKLEQPADKITLKTEDDFIDAKWFSKSELKTLTLSPPTAIMLQKLGYL